LLLGAYAVAGLPRISEVVVCFDSKILRGNRATRVSSLKFTTTFRSPYFPALGEIGDVISIQRQHLQPTPLAAKNFALATCEWRRVKAVLVHSEMPLGELQLEAARDSGVEGLVIDTYRSGDFGFTDKKTRGICRAASLLGLIVLQVARSVDRD